MPEKFRYLYISTFSRKFSMKPEDFIHNADAPTHTVYVQYKGIFDMDDLYQSIADFFMEKKFKFYEK